MRLLQQILKVNEPTLYLKEYPYYDKRNGFSNFEKFKEFHFLKVSDTMDFCSFTGFNFVRVV